MPFDVIKVIVPFLVSFCVGIGITPFIADFLYRNKMWKKKAGKVDAQGNVTVEFNKLHKTREVSTPRMGGVVIWLSAGITIGGIWLLAVIFNNSIFTELDFLSRSQTWVPLGALAVGALVGLFDDWYEIRGVGTHIAGGLSLRQRLGIVGLLGLLISLWFYIKLDISSISFFGTGELELGLLFIPFFVAVMWVIYAGGVIDGIDGLAGGIFATILTAYAVIAFSQSQINLAAFCATLSGATLAFLWFNIPPARFYMSETGSMALTTVVAVIAFMTDILGEGEGVLLLPLIAVPLIATVVSNIIQVTSKAVRGKKVFRIAPLHHHFEAIGWPSYKVTMRYWIISIVCALLGIILALVM